MHNGVVNSTGLALKAGCVVVEAAIGRFADEQCLGTICAQLVLAGLKQWKQRSEQLPAAWLVRLAPEARRRPRARSSRR